MLCSTPCCILHVMANIAGHSVFFFHNDIFILSTVHVLTEKILAAWLAK